MQLQAPAGSRPREKNLFPAVCRALRRSALLLTSSSDGNHHGRSLDHGVSFAADFKAQALSRSRGDRGNDLFLSFGFNRHFGGHRTFLDGDDGALEAVVSRNFHINPRFLPRLEK